LWQLKLKQNMDVNVSSQNIRAIMQNVTTVENTSDFVSIVSIMSEGLGLSTKSWKQTKP
jgi:hypothetical protein